MGILTGQHPVDSGKALVMEYSVSRETWKQRNKKVNNKKTNTVQGMQVYSVQILVRPSSMSLYTITL